jgi:hypothetical protein
MGNLYYPYMYMYMSFNLLYYILSTTLYSIGAIMGNLYYPDLGVQYEYRPLDRAEGSYSLREVPMSPLRP